MHFICFRFLSTALQTRVSWGLSVGKATHNDTRNLETVCCTVWHLRCKIQYEVLRVNLKIFIFILMKIKHLGHMMFGVITIDDDIIPPFIFQHGLILSTKAYINWLEELVLLWIEWLNAERVYVWYYASQAEKLSLGCEKISTTILYLTSGHTTPDCRHLNDHVCGAIERESKKPPWNTEPWTQGTNNVSD